jgi:predicted nucleic acid-binding protein
MTFADIAVGSPVFVANCLIYHFSPHPTFGPSCHSLIALMIVEANSLPGSPVTANVPRRLKRQPLVVQQLTAYEKAVNDVLQSRLQVLAVKPNLIANAAALSRQFGLLTNDTLVVAIMQDQNIVGIASHDSDFDRVPTITRYAPS